VIQVNIYLTPIPHLTSPLKGEELVTPHPQMAAAFPLPFKGRAGVGMGCIPFIRSLSTLSPTLSHQGRGGAVMGY